MTPFDVTPETDFDRNLSAWLDARAQPTAPEHLLGETLVRTRQTRPRSAWRIPERWIPMTLIAARSTVAPPSRAVWTLLLIGLLTVALVASLAVIGAQLLRSNDPLKLRGGLMVPALELDRTWDATTIDGLSQPSGLDVGPDGNLYVVNAGASEILVLDPDGNVLRRWGEQGTGDGQFIFHGDPTDPTATFGGVSVSPDGSSVYVTDDANDRVQQFDANGDFVRSWGRYGTADGEFLAPLDVSAGPDGTVYVVDNSREDIQHFDAQGSYLSRIDSAGPQDAPLSTNGGLAVDGQGNVFNVDYDHGLLRSWAPDGAYRWSLGDRSDGPAHLALPGDVATDMDGNIYVSEIDRVAVFKPDGSLASTWDAPTATTEEEWLPIAVGADGTVYLSARYANVIYKLSTVQREPLNVEGSVDQGVASVPEPASTAIVLDASGAVPPIRSLTFGDLFPVPFTLELPPGWERGDELPGVASVGADVADDPATTSVLVQIYTPGKVYTDPCLGDRGPVTVVAESDIGSIAAILAEQPGLRLVTPMTDIAIDGHAGTSFDQESMIDTKGCEDGTWLKQWTFQSAVGEEYRGLASGQHHRLIVLDVDGTPVIIEVWSFPWTSRAHLLEAEQVVKSIDFE